MCIFMNIYRWEENRSCTVEPIAAVGNRFHIFTKNDI
jgi:hypothetical protein